MTPAEKLGYKVGMRFKVTNKVTFSLNSIIELSRDDGSDAPLFDLVEGSCSYGLGVNTEKGAYLSLTCIEPIAEATGHKFKVRDVVRLRGDSQYSGQSEGTDGEAFSLKGYSSDSDYTCKVRWGSGNENSYRDKDLDLITEEEEISMDEEFKAGDLISKKSGKPFKSGTYVAEVDYVHSDGKLSLLGTTTKIHPEKVYIVTTTAAPAPMSAPPAAIPPMAPIKKETTIMSQITIKQQTLINGVVSDSYDDDHLFSMIASREAEIAQLDKIDNKPQTLLDKMKDMGVEVASLVAFIDDRTAAKKG